MMNKVDILGVGITAASREKILEYVVTALKKRQKKLFVVTPNPEIVTYAQSHLDYQDKLNSSDVSLCDGVGVLIASKLMRKGLVERFSGVDFIEELCKKGSELPLSMGFLGGRGGVAEAAAECLHKKYPWIHIAFAGASWPQQGKPDYPKKHIDMLFVAFGAPKQEEWITEHLPSLPVSAAIGVGGAFDYFAGNVRRAPSFVRAAGFEWLFRLINQPWRIKRQLALVRFTLLVLKQTVFHIL